jgi:hypothetical protein
VSARVGAVRAVAELARRHRLASLLSVSACGALTLAFQRWWSWEGAIRARFASDMSAYEAIARSAPSFPADHFILRPFAERFPVHWLIGSLAQGLDLSLHGLYRVFDLVVLGLLLWTVHLALARMRLDPSAHTVAIGTLAFSAYPVHYLLAAPGMLSDGVFCLGLSVTLLGFAGGRFELVLGGLLVGMLGRQTMVGVAIAAALWTALTPAWRARRWPYTTAAVMLPVGLWLVLHFVADSFAQAELGGIHDLTVLGFLTKPGALAGHVGRAAIGVLLPCALIAGAWLRARDESEPASEAASEAGTGIPRGPLLVAAAVIVQPLLLGPTSAGHNETRLAALAVPALAVAGGALMGMTRLGRGETAVLAAAILAGGLHHRYTHAGLDRPWQWVALEAAAAVVMIAVLARPHLRRL